MGRKEAGPAPQAHLITPWAPAELALASPDPPPCPPHGPQTEHPGCPFLAGALLTLPRLKSLGSELRCAVCPEDGSPCSPPPVRRSGLP